MTPPQDSNAADGLHRGYRYRQAFRSALFSIEEATALYRAYRPALLLCAADLGYNVMGVANLPVVLLNGAMYKTGWAAASEIALSLQGEFPPGTYVTMLDMALPWGEGELWVSDKAAGLHAVQQRVVSAPVIYYAVIEPLYPWIATRLAYSPQLHRVVDRHNQPEVTEL